LVRAFSVFSGAVLVYSGLLHAWQPFYFAHNVAAYGVLPAPLIMAVVLLAPYLQLVVGVCLAARLEVRLTRWLALALFGSFVIMQAKVLIRGEHIRCGCFGFASETVSWKTIAIPAALFLIALISFVCDKILKLEGRRPSETS
jgi:hypothetical protein